MVQSASIRNQLLTALPPQALAQLLPQLQIVTLPVRQRLLASGEPTRAVYFIERGWASMVAHLTDGIQAEVGLIGWEGLVGSALVAGVETEFSETYMQADGAAFRMGSAEFRRALENIPSLRTLLLRYNQALHAQTAQTAGCNGRHALEQRLARWLLMAHDRTEGDQLPLTQEFLAMMLCVQRPSVTGAARSLQSANIIRYAQGSITILNRDALEAAACNCYGVVIQRFRQLLG